MKFDLSFFWLALGRVFLALGEGCHVMAEKLDNTWEQVRGKRYVHAATFWTWEYGTGPVEFGGQTTSLALIGEMVRSSLGDEILPKTDSEDADETILQVGDSVNFRVGLLKIEDAALLKIKYGGQMKEQKLYELV